MSFISRKDKSELEALMKKIPIYEWEDILMKGRNNTVYECISSHSMSQDEFNKTWLLSRMRTILEEKPDLTAYTTGISYSDAVGRKDIAQYLKEQLNHNLPVFGFLYTSLLSLILKIHNPFR